MTTTTESGRPTVAEGPRAPRERRRRTLPWRTPVIVLAALLAWEVVGRLSLIGGGALPAPTAIAEAWWQSRADYPAHVVATARVAGAGFVIGNLAAIVLAIVYQLVPAIERLTRTTAVVLFCLPVVVISPILGVAFDGDWPKIALSILLVFFPTLISTHLGLSRAPGDAVGVVRASGGGALRQLWLVRLRAAVPEMLAGLQIAAPAAVLGAILGEFLGSRHGLGIYLIGSMARGDAAIIWAIGLTATALSASLYGLVGLARPLFGIEASAVAETGLPLAHRTRRLALGETIAWWLGGTAVLLLTWFAFIASTGLPRTLMNSPIEVWESLVSGPRAADYRERVIAALPESLGPAIIGGAAGLAVAFLLAVVLSSSPVLSRSFMPFAFISQTIPLVALAPLIALILGRGTATTIAVTVSVTFFPSLVTIMQGIAATPSGPLLVARSVNASRLTVLRLVIVPSAVPHLLASVRLAVPRALTGVLIAEQFITGAGLGNLMSIARGFLDYRMMWVVTVVVVAFSVLVYALAQSAETAVLRRRGS